MPEIPDLTVYVEALERRLVGATLRRVRIISPTLLRSVLPTVDDVEGKQVLAVRRLAKRVVLSLEQEFFLIFHLMVAGRFHWKPPGSLPGRKGGLAAFEFDSGSLVLVERSTRKRASLHLVRGESALQEHDPGGLELEECSSQRFASALTGENHTLKRALTDPHIFAGIGNAYSDEILHRARLSPVRLTQRLEPDEITRLHAAARETLELWTRRLREEAGDEFPEKVTPFRDGMAVHGRYRKPCPDCGSPVQRIVYAANETNYCASCQTGGKLLADRALSRLLKRDWPRKLEELEELRRCKGVEAKVSKQRAPT